MTVPERLEALREKMRDNAVDAWLVLTDDFHNSEYVGEYFKCRQFITGFTGSAGTALILKESAYLWTDGRYFLQAASQLEGSGVTLMKMGEEGVPTLNAFLSGTLESGATLGFDGRTMSAFQAEGLIRLLSAKEVKVRTDLDLISEIWTDRPSLSCEKITVLEERFAGRSRSAKLSQLRRAMAAKKASHLLLSSLDDIAWLLNLRGGDIHCNPVFLSYMALTHGNATLFVQKDAVSEELAHELSLDGITLRPYEEVYSYAAEIPGGSVVMLDRHRLNYALRCALSKDVRCVFAENPTLLSKAVKNPVEVANIRKAHIKDGVAVTRFIYWLKKTVGKETVTELSAAEKLEEFRSRGKNYQGPSFDPIIAYGPHAAIVHYSATPQTDAVLKAKGLLLADTGGQYLEGTTDITRTIALGPVTRKEKEMFTRVLQGHLNLAAATFLYGCSGRNLDILARSPLWEIGEDYNHGTGHGVGFFLNVHEGPQYFHWRNRPAASEAVLEEGMITSDEPGYYLEGKFGIRHENLVVCRKGKKTAAGQFMKFDTLTLVPFDLDAVIPEMLTAEARKQLNAYHRKVYEKVAPHLNEEERAWLEQATREV